MPKKEFDSTLNNHLEHLTSIVADISETENLQKIRGLLSELSNRNIKAIVTIDSLMAAKRENG